MSKALRLDKQFGLWFTFISVATFFLRKINSNSNLYYFFHKYKYKLVSKYIGQKYSYLIEKYKNYYLYITQDEQHELPDGQYYYRQIIGLKVIDENEHYLGTIKEIMSPGANDVWIVEKPNKAELLLPVIDDVIKSVDLDKQEVHIEMMDGLDDED